MSKETKPLEWTRSVTAELEKAGVPNPRLDAELLVAHVLNCKRIDLYTRPNRRLRDPELTTLYELLKRRLQREPLQYIIGNTEFYGLGFQVTPAVLIPRPETEVLVEGVLKIGGGVKELNLLDIGTGSGCIAITLAKMLPHAKLVATEISKEALEVARQNAKLNEVEGRIEFILADIAPWKRFLAEGRHFDVILSNPPYISTGEFPKIQPEVRDFEPRKALDGGREGLDFYRTILKDAARYLKPGGWIFFEVGDGEAGPVQLLMKEAGLSEISAKKDLRNFERVVRGKRT